MSGNAQELFSKAQEAEKKGNIKRAIKAYRTLVRRHPKDTLAPGSLYRMAQLQEQTREYLKAAQSYAVLAERFPKSERFDESIEALFRIGEMYLAGRKVKISRHSVQGSMDEAANIFTAIIRTAPYGKYTARAQFDIGPCAGKTGRQRCGHGGLPAGRGEVPERSARGRRAISDRIYLVARRCDPAPTIRTPRRRRRLVFKIFSIAIPIAKNRRRRGRT